MRRIRNLRGRPKRRFMGVEKEDMRVDAVKEQDAEEWGMEVGGLLW